MIKTGVFREGELKNALLIFILIGHPYISVEWALRDNAYSVNVTQQISCGSLFAASEREDEVVRCIAWCITRREYMSCRDIHSTRYYEEGIIHREKTS